MGVSPQLLEQLSVEGGSLGLSCYLSPEGKGGGGLLSITPLLHIKALTPLGETGKRVARLLIKQMKPVKQIKRKTSIKL